MTVVGGNIRVAVGRITRMGEV
ncbi:uncharacterized protein G2W53_012794 [Senna tora]|uniref:Uncharacterized protein n=1 Tax=Senna tora TaxID=362788 RepID=A0A834U130_9FABA|nr:uncharacterized protein G2W53_012794 [Senna tora]